MGFVVALVRHLTSAEFAFLFMVSNTISTFGDIRKCYFAQKGRSKHACESIKKKKKRPLAPLPKRK